MLSREQRKLGGENGPKVNRAWYSATISEFITAPADEILGQLARRNEFELTEAQRSAWVEEIALLRCVLAGHTGTVYLEFAIPRMGTRVDAVVIIGPVLFVVEFKIGEGTFHSRDVDQVVDYALDLRNFHEGSHGALIAPVLVCPEAADADRFVPAAATRDGLFVACQTNSEGLRGVLATILGGARAPDISVGDWEASRYRPTPTIIEATLALYRRHSVSEISRNDAGATNLTRTSSTVAELVAGSRARAEKAICFVSGSTSARQSGRRTRRTHTAFF
jgi:hypothetical protein